MDIIKEIESIPKEEIYQLLVNTFFKYRDLANTDELYYYTDTSTLISGILRSKAICLWASRWSHLNDSQELINGIEAIENIGGPSYLTEALYKSNYLGHIISMSMAKDSLPMWSMYGNEGKGVMMIFDAQELLKKYGGRIQPCIYSNSEYDTAVVDKIVNFQDSLRFHWNKNQQLYASFIQSMHFVTLRKDYHYEYEKEVRIIGIGNPYYDTEKEINYRYRKDKIIPYVEENIPKSALKGICFGPLSVYENSQCALIEFLTKNDYKDVVITKSEIPYRG